MPTACLADRALVSVSGPDAEHFLVHRQETLPGGTRTIYLVEAKP